VKIDPARFNADPAEVARTLLFTDATPSTRAAIDKALADKTDKKDKTPAFLAGLVIGSPDFQRR
jgi:hypothetical protein